MDEVLALLRAIAAKLGVALPVTTDGDTNVLIPSGPVPTAPLPNPDDEGEVLRYAVHGYKYDLTRGVDPGDFPKMLALATDLLRATTAEGREAVIGRASLFPPLVAAYGVLTGCTQGFGFGLQPKLTFPNTIQTVRDAALYAAFQPVGGPGPSGR